MNPSTNLIAEATPRKKVDADRVGVFLSVLCAIHCAATPILLIVLPTFGKIWSHPASHWGMALFVVPIAVLMLTSGYRRHRKKWIIATGALGISLVIVGAILPYIEKSSSPEPVAVETKAEEEVFTYVVGGSDTTEAEEAAFVYVKGEEMPETSCGSGCTDNCCPSLITDADGKMRLNIPPASIVTTLGGVSLIITHMGNLCCCSACRRRKLFA
ncbi:MAG: MerC domain-containing protein [Verrucomicrobiales bacterium]|nr:MerC domain-containing protein [Verrucomicrobiales bacterium]